MSTRSSIAVVKPDGTLRAVYCHWDGYPEGVGQILANYHNNEEEANKIISLGNISSLRELLEPTGEGAHSFDHPQENVTIFYDRDRGENGQEAQLWSCVEAWLKNASEWYGAEYCYWWKDGKWNCFDISAQKPVALYDEKVSTRLIVNTDTNTYRKLIRFMDDNNIDYEEI